VSVTVKPAIDNNKKLTLTVSNATKKSISINPFSFPLQKLNNGIWEDVKEKPSERYHQAALREIKAGKKWSKIMDLDSTCENITPGQYALEVVGAKRGFFTIGK
jgi:hypothetical protein